MRRKNLGNRIVKKAITWAMIVMMSFSGAMSGFASMTVYAEGIEAQVDVDENDGDLQQSYGTSAVTFDNKENTESQVSDEKPAEITEVPDLLPEGVAKNVQSAEEASKAAQNAANAAAQAVKDLSGSDTRTRGPCWTDLWFASCAARCIAGYPSLDWISAEGI